MATENTAILASAMTDGKATPKYIGVKFLEIIEPAQNVGEEKSADEIISGFLRDFGAKEVEPIECI